MPCLFLGIHFPENHFPHFLVNIRKLAKKNEFRLKKKLMLYDRNVFFFSYHKENTFLCL
jgi:hypothetical protein